MDIAEPILSLQYSNKIFTLGLRYSVQVYSLFDGLCTTIRTAENLPGVHALQHSEPSKFAIATPDGETKKKGVINVSWFSVRAVSEQSSQIQLD